MGADSLATGRKENVAHLSEDARFRLLEIDICERFDPGPVDYVFNMAPAASPPE